MTDADDVLSALLSYHSETGLPVATAPDLEDRLPIGRRRILELLRLLEARGDVASRSVARGRAWWSVDAVDVRAEIPPAAPPAEPPAEPLEAPPEEPPEEAASGAGAYADAVADLGLPGSGERLEERRQAVVATLQLLEERGQASAAEIKSEIFPRFDVGYTRAEDPERSWWKNCMSGALSKLRDRGVVRLVDKHGGVYALDRANAPENV